MATTDPQPVAGVSLRQARWIVVLFAALTTVPLILRHDLWHADEPRYAQVAREILRDGDWVVLHLNQEVYTEKPPLYFWCEALLGMATGDIGPFAARFPSALAGAIGVLLCFELGRRLFDARVGLAAALVLAISQRWCWIAQRCALDVMLATLVLGAVLLEEVARANLKAGRVRRAAWIRVAAFAVVGLGFLTKGPPALVPFVFWLVARAWAERDQRSLGRIPWLRGLLAFFAVIAPWAVPWVMTIGIDEVKQILFRNTAGRMSGEVAHVQPWHYYLRTIPSGFLPWSLAWLAIAWLAWRARRASPADKPPPVSVGERAMLGLCVLSVIVFSCFSGKRTIYLLPLQPALALWTTAAIVRLWPRGPSETPLLVLRRIAVGGGLLATAGVYSWMPYADHGGSIGPIEIESRSPRVLGESVRRQLDLGRHVALVDIRHPDAVLYFSDAPRLEVIEVPDDPPIHPQAPGAIRLRELVAEHGDRLVLLLEAWEEQLVTALLPDGGEPIEKARCDGRDYMLVRARAPKTP